jgi:UDP:flavonoid glycosyltransferase YjiC (YdhE family)
MHYVAKAGAGECLRADSLTGDAVRSVVARLLAEDRYRRAASMLADAFKRYDPGRILASVIGEAVGG